MKVFLLLLLIPIISYANPFTYRVDTSTTNIAATFPTTAQVSGPTNAIVMAQVDNSTGSEIEVNCTKLTTPSSNSVDSFYVSGNTAWETPVGVSSIIPALGKYCWVRSVSGTISSGILRITVWGY